jgi:hypothetical protein
MWIHILLWLDKLYRGNFHLGPQGQKNVQQALERSKVHGSIGNAIWFGIGVQSLIRTLAQTEEGTCLLALCSALGGCIHHDLAAEVLHSMAKSYKSPDSLTPSIMQWLELVKSCAGLFAATDFPALAEKFMNLDPSHPRLTTYHADIQPGISGRGFPVTDDLANALIGLCEISSNQLATITIKGGAACGWLAAVAEWLLDLSVTIYYNDRTLYSSHSDELEAQVQLIFHSEQTANLMGIETVSNTYFLRDSADFLHLEDEGARITTMTGRLYWESCLHDVFGQEFRELMKSPSTVGCALGCTARFFKAVVAGESAIDQQITHDWQSYFDAANGLGFVNNTIQWFPELKAVEPHMESGAKMTLSNAMRAYENQIAMLEKRCSCRLCRQIDDNDHDSDVFCLGAILETIVVLSLALAGMSVEEGILPTRAGFELFYTKQQLIRIVNNQAHSDQPYGNGPFYNILQAVSRSDAHEMDNAENRLRDAAKLFTGRDSWESLPFETTALSANGICIYSGVLRNLSLDRGCCGLVYITAGRIERDAKPFDLVVDRKCRNSPPVYDELIGLSDISLIVEERVRSLGLSFKLSSKRSAGVHIEPAQLLYTVSCSRGLFSCSRYKCPEISSIKENGSEQFRQYQLGGKDILIYNKGNVLSQCAILYLTSSRWSDESRCILRTSECIQCSLLAATKMEGTKNVFIIS